MAFSTLQITGAVAALSFLAGLTFGELHGRGKIYLKWNKEIVKTEQAAGDLEDKVEDVEDAQEDRVEDGKKKQRAEDTVSRQSFTALERTLNNERTYFEEQLAKARADTSSCNCANLDMPIGLQRRVSERPPSTDQQDESNNPGADSGRSTRSPALRRSRRD